MKTRSPKQAARAPFPTLVVALALIAGLSMGVTGSFAADASGGGWIHSILSFVTGGSGDEHPAAPEQPETGCRWWEFLWCTEESAAPEAGAGVPAAQSTSATRRFSDPVFYDADGNIIDRTQHDWLINEQHRLQLLEQYLGQYPRSADSEDILLDDNAPRIEDTGVVRDINGVTFSPAIEWRPALPDEIIQPTAEQARAWMLPRTVPGSDIVQFGNRVPSSDSALPPLPVYLTAAPLVTGMPRTRADVCRLSAVEQSRYPWINCAAVPALFQIGNDGTPMPGMQFTGTPQPSTTSNAVNTATQPGVTVHSAASASATPTFNGWSAVSASADSYMSAASASAVFNGWQQSASASAAYSSPNNFNGWSAVSASADSYMSAASASAAFNDWQQTASAASAASVSSPVSNWNSWQFGQSASYVNTSAFAQ